MGNAGCVRDAGCRVLPNFSLASPSGHRLILPMAGDTKARILIADDQVDVLEALRLLSKAEGLRAETVNSPQAVKEALWGKTP